MGAPGMKQDSSSMHGRLLVDTSPRAGQLIDRYRHLHSEAALTNWSAATLKAMGIRRVGDKVDGKALAIEVRNDRQ